MRTLLAWSAAVLFPALSPAAPILNRDPRAYMILAERIANVKNLAIEAPGCSVGVNCAQVGRSRHCGILRAKNASFAGSSQVAADNTCATSSFFEVFRNGPATCAPGCSMIAVPGPNPDCSTPLTTPILGDLDGDGTPSCDDACRVDPGDLAAACGVALPLPDCDPAKPIVVRPDEDCLGIDLVPGNHRCDLPAGTYGALVVRNGARINFAAGTTVLCSLTAGKATRVTSTGDALVLVPGNGNVAMNNLSDVGGQCGALRIVTEKGGIRLGRAGDYTLDACAIAGHVSIGHSNNLRGHVLGDVVTGNVNNDGRCCSLAKCGNGQLDTGEQCDASAQHGDDACSGRCAPPGTPGECTCLPVSTTSTSTTSSSTSTSLSTTSSSTSTSSTSSTSPGQTSTTSTTARSTSTSTSTSSSSSTTHPTSSSSSTSTSSLPTTTTVRTTTTTVPGGDAFTRTPGFYKTHPITTQNILTAVGGLTVCGKPITNVDVDHADSALEGMCIAVHGDQRLQLVRQLIAAALSGAAGGARFPDLSRCDAVCADSGSSSDDVSTCAGEADAFNESGDNVPAPFDGAESADPGPCQQALQTACTVLDSSSCAAP